MTWTEERRRKASENACKNKPWLKSTGPRTKQGKIRSCMNAAKHGARSRDLKAVRKALGHQRAFLKYAQLYFSHDTLERRRTNELIEKLKENSSLEEK